MNVLFRIKGQKCNLIYIVRLQCGVYLMLKNIKWNRFFFGLKQPVSAIMSEQCFVF